MFGSIPHWNIWVQVTAPLPIQLSANAHPERQKRMAQVLESLPLGWEISMELPAPGVGPAEPHLLQPFGEHNSRCGSCVCSLVSLSLSLSICQTEAFKDLREALRLRGMNPHWEHRVFLFDLLQAYRRAAPRTFFESSSEATINVQ